MKKSLIVTICIIVLLFLVGCNNSDDTSLKCTNCGEPIAADAKFCPQCGETVLNPSDDDNSGEQCSHSWKTATCTEAKTCSKCGETEGNALGHTTTTGVCDRCHIRQGWSENEVQSLIKIYDIFVSDIDSADGVDMQIAWENTSSKTIKYIYFTVEAYNAVDDKVACEIRDSYQFIGESTGPFESGHTNLIYDAQKDSYSINTVFENCYYNANIRYFEITNIRIVYMDNTEFELDEDSVNYAFAEIPQGLYYTWNNEYNGYEVNYRLKDKCTATEITVPATYNDSNVVAIANGAFKGIASLQEIHLPDSISQIGNSAFWNCSNLKKVNIPNKVKVLNSSIFSDCTSLQTITLHNAITSIDSYAFSDCTALKEIIIPNSVTKVGDGVFSNCTSLVEIIVPNSVVSIGYGAFEGCTKLNIMTIPFIGETNSGTENLYFAYIFGEPSWWYSDDSYVPESLKSVVITNDTTIETRAFENCYDIVSITFEKNVTSIGDYAFLDCRSLNSTPNLSAVTTIGCGAFNGCDSLTSVEIAEGVSEIDEWTFYGCSTLTRVVIPESVTTIGAHAFDTCLSLVNINFKGTTQQWNDVYKAGFWDGYGYSADYTIICSNGIINPDGTVVEKDDGQNISINYTLSEDGSYYIIFATEFFSDENLVVPSEYKGKPVKEIGEAAFEYNTSLKSISIPSSIVKIGDSAFYFCKNLESINIPEGVVSIGAWAFKDCSKLVEVVIPSSITDIGNSAFSGCVSLTDITVDSDNTVYKSIAGNLYSNDGKTLIQYAVGKTDTSFKVPETVISIDDYAFLGCTKLTKIIISNNVVNIGWDVFNGCINLTIYCAASGRNAGWDTDWNYCFEHTNGTDYCTVIWNYTE